MELYNPLNGQQVAGSPKEKKAEKGVPTSDLILRYQNEIRVSEKYFAKNWWKRADRHVHMYELDHFFDPDLQDTPSVDYDRIRVAYGYANSRQILAEIYMKNPEPIVKPKKKNKTGPPLPPDPSMSTVDPTTGQPMDQGAGFTPMLTTMGQSGAPIDVDVFEGAKKLKASIQYCVDKSNLERVAKMATLDGIVTGMGIWMMSGQKDSKVPKYTRIVYKGIRFWEGVENPYESPWVVRRLVRPLEDAKADEAYNPKVREKMNANHKVDPTLTGDITDSLGQFNYVVLWDRWDKKNDTHCIWADNGTEFLVEEKMSDVLPFDSEDDEFEFEYPFIFFVNGEMISKPLGIGDIWPIEPQIRENDKVRTMQLQHIKRFNRKYGMTKGMLDAGAMNALKAGEDGTFVEFKDDNWAAKFQVIEDAPISRDVYNVGELIDRDIQLISPIGPNSLSRGVGKRPDTLGEAQIIEESTNTRLDEKRDALAKCFGRTFRFTAQYIQKFWVEEDVLLVTGDGSKPTDWLEYTPDEVKGEYTYDVDPETLRDNTVAYRKQITEAIQTVGPLLAQVNPAGMPVLLRQYLGTFPTLEKMIDQIVPETAPQQPGVVPETGESPERQMLVEAIEKNGPEAVLDMIKQLPQNEQERLMAEVNSIFESMRTQPASAGPVPGQPAQAMPPKQS